jgi:transcriptional regulator with XRE-family HTH domain/Zn-dependent peptidase ImmA (M78 family)
MIAYTTFGDFIREKRNESDMGLREAARNLGISASYLSRLEAGELRPPSGTVLLRIAQLYNCDMKEILTKASNREHEVMAADTDVAPAVQAFYRLAYDQSPEVQERMLRGAIDALDLAGDQKEKLMVELRNALSRTQGKDLPRRANDTDGLFAFDIAPRILSRLNIRQLARGVLQAVFATKIPIPVPVETVICKADRDIVFIVHDEMEGGRLRDGSPTVLGLSRWSRDGKRRELVIHEDLFEAEDDRTRRRAHFTMAHELFHCLEHLPLAQQRHPDKALARKIAFATLSPSLLNRPWYEGKRRKRNLLTHEDWREWQANEFAAELLMPAEAVASTFQTLFGVPQIVARDGEIEELADELARKAMLDEDGEPACLVERFDVNPQAMAIRILNLRLVVSQVESSTVSAV